MNKDAQDDHIWLLLSNKLANEATKDELQELDRLLLLNPDIGDIVSILTDWWNNSPPE